MHISPVGFQPIFKANECKQAECKHNECGQQCSVPARRGINWAKTTGYLSLGSFGVAMITGMEKKMKLHRASCYLSIAAAVAHIASLNSHKHHKSKTEQVK